MGNVFGFFHPLSLLLIRLDHAIWKEAKAKELCYLANNRCERGNGLNLSPAPCQGHYPD